eukprot:jgi/Orpsp1_1/1192883/evm.model.d7180000096644.1
MKLNYLLKGLISSTLLCSFAVKAQEYKGDCKDVKDIAYYCKEDDQGKLIILDIAYDDNLSEKDWEKLLSYKSIKELNLYRIKKGFNQKNIDKIGSLTNLEKLDIGSSSTFDKNLNFESFQNLTNLKKLLIRSDEDKVIEKNIIKNFKNLNYLYIGEAKLDEYDLSEISSVEKIEKLELNIVSFEKNLNYDFKNINELEIDESEIDKNFFAGFKNLKKLTLNNELQIEQYHIDEISTISSLEEINCNFPNSNVDLNIFKNLKNLKRCYVSNDIKFDNLKDVKN